MSLQIKGGCLTAAMTLGLWLFAPQAFASATSEGQGYFDQADRLQKSGDLAGALIQLKNAVRADPDLIQARFELGVLYLRSGDPSAAQRELESARARGYDEKKLLQPLMQAYLGQGHYNDVIKNFDPAKFEGDTRAEVLAAQARAHIAMQELKPAHDLIDQALAQAPTLPAVVSAAAILARTDQRYSDAEKYVDEGLAKDPDNAELLVLKAEARQQVKDYDSAVKVLDHAIEKYPRYARAHLARAMINIARNKPETVSGDVRDVLAVEPKNPLGLYLQAWGLAQDHKYRDASQVLLGLPELLEAYPPARYLLAAAYFADNQLQSALSNIDLYLEKAPGDITGTKLLAAIAMRLNDPARAVQVLEPLAQAHADDKALRLQLASALLGAGRADEAVKLFEEGVKEDPQNVDARMALAVSELRSGALDTGVSQLQELVQAKPESLQASQLLVLTQIQERHFDKALATAEAAVKASPSPEAYNLMGAVNLAASNLDAARSAFKDALGKNAKYLPAMLNLARVEERSKDIKGAMSWYHTALDADPRNMTAYNGLAGLALVDKNPAEAVKVLEQAIAAVPSDPQPRLRLIEVLFQTKQTGPALAAARDLADTLPGDPRSVDALGRAQMAAGEYVSGLATYRQLVTLLPKNPEAKRRLAHALADAANDQAKAVAGDQKSAPAKDSLLKEAQTTLDAAIVDNPDYSAALADRVALERSMAGDAAALSLAEKLAKDQPGSTARMMIAGDFSTMIGKNDLAVTYYRAAWNKTKAGQNLRQLYAALARDGKGTEGLQMLQAWTAQHTDDYDTRFLIASVEIDAGHLDDALKETVSISKVMPDNPLLLNNLAWLYGEKNDPRAFEFGQKAIDLAPNSPQILDTMGWMEAQKRDVKKGVILLAKSYELAPASPVISYHYAAALRRSGDTAKAKEVLTKTLENKSPFKERADAEILLKGMGG